MTFQKNPWEDGDLELPAATDVWLGYITENREIFKNQVNGVIPLVPSSRPSASQIPNLTDEVASILTYQRDWIVYRNWVKSLHS